MSLAISCYAALLWKNEKDQLHREKGPAFLTTYGYMEYCFNDLIHRSNGPARIWPDGDVEYYLNGNRCSKKEYFNIVRPKVIKK